MAGLAACADPAAHWHKAGIADAERTRDYQACHDLARDSARAGIDQDLAASRSAAGHGPESGAPVPDSVDTGASRAASQAMIACMTDRGYRGD
jgi:hypothetical protein